jgi:Putative Ig domain
MTCCLRFLALIMLLFLPWVDCHAVETQLLVTASDDGLPNNSLTYTWSVITAPAGATGTLAAQILSSPSTAIPGASAQNPRVVLSVAGVYKFHVSVSDGALTTTGSSAQDVLVTVLPPVPAITTSNLAGAQVGSPYSQSLQATNSATSWVISSGALPAGLTLSASNGLISGTPTSIGSSSFSVRASNASGTSAPVSLTLAVTSTNTRPTITSLTDRSVDLGTAIPTQTFTIGDAQTPLANLTVSVASNAAALVPNSGLHLGGSGATRTLNMTPASGQTGRATITVTVSDAGGLTATSSFVLTINAASVSTTGSANISSSGEGGGGGGGCGLGTSLGLCLVCIAFSFMRVGPGRLSI